MIETIDLAKSGDRGGDSRSSTTPLAGGMDVPAASSPKPEVLVEGQADATVANCLCEHVFIRHS
jgi:hypothetical protein